jgi:hypothetical protein
VTPAIPVTPAGLTAAEVPQSHHTPNADKMYTVNPPVGRFHESLWEIAQNTSATAVATGRSSS